MTKSQRCLVTFSYSMKCSKLYISSISSSSCRVTITIFLDSLSQFVPYYLSYSAGPLVYILCPYRAVVNKFSLVVQQLVVQHLLIRGPQENVIYEFLPTSPAVFHMSCSYDLDVFRDGR